MDKPKSTEWPSEDRIESIGQNGPSGDHYEDDAFRECERRLREAELEADVSACTRCDELASQLKTSRRDYEVMNKFREGAEAERDALAAHVEQANLQVDAFRKVEGSPLYLAHLIGKWRDDSPETSLERLKAQWQAEAIARVICDLEAEFDPCHPIIERVEHIESEYLRQAGGDV